MKLFGVSVRSIESALPGWRCASQGCHFYNRKIRYNIFMKKILIIQSRTRPEMLAAEQGEYARAIGSLAEAVFVSSLDESLDWQHPEKIVEGFSGVIFGGSGEFDFDGGRPHDDAARATSQQIVARVRPLVLDILQKDFPMMGICYGHQIVAEALGVPVINDLEQKKTGTYEVALTPAGKADKLFCDMPERFPAQFGHKDSLSRLPDGAVLLADGANCKTSALRYGSHVYTMQFHPELTAEDVAWKLKNSPGYLPEGVDVSSIVKPSLEASTLIPKFIERIVS